jgi:hypothetical protein
MKRLIRFFNNYRLTRCLQPYKGRLHAIRLGWLYSGWGL